MLNRPGQRLRWLCTGRFVFEGFLKRLLGISSKENAPGLDTGDFTYEGYLTRGAVLPLKPSQPWVWLPTDVPWSSVGVRPVSATTSALLTPCFGAIWLGPLIELRSPGRLPSPSRGQLATFSVSEFGGLYGGGGIGSLTQPHPTPTPAPPACRPASMCPKPWLPTWGSPPARSTAGTPAATGLPS